jgi:hypothetical protein
MLRFALDTADLPGIVVILKKQFSEPPVTMIFSSLRDWLTNEEDLSPYQLKSWVGSRLLVWGEYGLFECFTPDLLFTFVAIQKLKYTDLARRPYQGVMDAMRARPQEFTKEALQGRKGMEEMSLFQMVMDMIDVESRTLPAPSRETSWLMALTIPSAKNIRRLRGSVGHLFALPREPLVLLPVDFLLILKRRSTDRTSLGSPPSADPSHHFSPANPWLHRLFQDGISERQCNQGFAGEK